MHLRSIELRDWKAFEAVRFDLPAPTSDRNVILIGGLNGYGKTTLFEAIALGLFGRDGLRLISRATAAADEQARIQSFRDFMERALHGYALERGRYSCRIGLQFEDNRGQPLWVERTWHFTDGGKLRIGDSSEQLRIIQGLARKVVGPGNDVPDPQGWYREWISRNFLPTSLAGFFLFDGEAASIYAERDMSVQVREGIEGLLGLTWLRTLVKALREYATNRRSQIPPGVSNKEITRLEGEIAVADRALDQAKKRLDEIAKELADAESERDGLTRELASYGTGTRAQLEELISERERRARQYGEAQDALDKIVARDLPLAMAGAGLRARVADRLRREVAREAWLASCQQGQARVAQVLDAVEARLHRVSPSLSAAQAACIRDVVREALDQLWHPPPDNVADDIRHTHARGPMAERIQARLEEATGLTVGTITALLSTMMLASETTRELDRAINASEMTAPQLEEKKARLRNLDTRITSLSQEKGERHNFVSSRQPELEQKQKELGRLTGLLDQSAPAGRRAKRAEEIAAMLDDLIAEAWPMQASAVGEAMTEGIRAMAHRSDYLNIVKITSDGTVLLLTPDGRNLREFDLSAGEKQIFTQALFAAIAKVSHHVFPLVVDTPLGRLDEEHRLNVLRYLASREGQVVLISTNTEVVGPYLDAIRPRVLKAYRIQNRRDGDLGVSWPVEGYFPGQGL